ncbi:hypothetical protein LC653_25960 [Nostoc sp. CHAB 5784]|uniref:hypothetical protein n=1 Tax=Nostoc mirabile TaxID=2907820 RepID=UPI001E52AC4B|nr:hypothetical protein [Nostoc mirabile]MCC5667238.1 hypothetical protein [Nostoc mirabile CHAB5784]
MRQPTAIATFMSLLIASSFPVFAQSKRLVSSRCRDNSCWELYLLSKKVIRQYQLEGKPRNVYQVQVENKTPRGTTPYKQISAIWLQKRDIWDIPYIWRKVGVKYQNRHLIPNQLFAIATLILFLATPFPVLAQNKRLVNSGCRQGFCWETYVLGKRVIRQDQLGGSKRTVYLVDLESKDSRGTNRQQRWVQCFTKEPFVAFIPPALDTDQVFIHYINPGGEFYGYNGSSHQMYWAICHNIWQANLSNMAGKARSLGYSLRLKTDQREVPKNSFNP